MVYTRFRRILSYIILGLFVLGIVRVVIVTRMPETAGLGREILLQGSTFLILALAFWGFAVLWRWAMARRLARTGGDRRGKE